ncbi:unnamed protein product [Albugo candida]|uniref:Uncharacterized protein n=1 Tax=Albugo candida TaxID=65357 RepID=A0A024FXM8_9STRA|nr:unnamed protein product [Albugo candida]|eukprot:CCI11667.1 unnamed protein product [Albugo candida]
MPYSDAHKQSRISPRFLYESTVSAMLRELVRPYVSFPFSILSAMELSVGKENVWSHSIAPEILTMSHANSAPSDIRNLSSIRSQIDVLSSNCKLFSQYGSFL